MLLSKIYVFVWAIVLAGSAVAAPAGSRKGQLSTLGYRTCSKVSRRSPYGGLLHVSIFDTDQPCRNKQPCTIKKTSSLMVTIGRKQRVRYKLEWEPTQHLLPESGWATRTRRIGKRPRMIQTPQARAHGRLIPTNVGGITNRNCVVQGNKDALDKHPKVWIPENLQWLDMDQTPLYNWAEKTYPKMDFETAFRLSEITRAPVGEYVKHEHTMQLLVPTQVLMDKDLEKKLGLRVECKRNWQDLPIKETVNYTKAWHRDSVFGTSQWRDPPVPASGSASPVAGGSPGKGCFGKCFGGSA